jgi:flagellar protein FlaG
MDVNQIATHKIDTFFASRTARTRNAENTDPEKVNTDESIKLTNENIDHLVDTLNSAAKSVNERVSFSFHEKTNRVIMKFTNPDTNEIVREIPPKEMIRLLEHMHDLIGVFVDESR